MKFHRREINIIAVQGTTYLIKMSADCRAGSPYAAGGGGTMGKDFQCNAPPLKLRIGSRNGEIRKEQIPGFNIHNRTFLNKPVRPVVFPWTFNWNLFC